MIEPLFISVSITVSKPRKLESVTVSFGGFDTPAARRQPFSAWTNGPKALILCLLEYQIHCAEGGSEGTFEFEGAATNSAASSLRDKVKEPPFWLNSLLDKKIYLFDTAHRRADVPSARVRIKSDLLPWTNVRFLLNSEKIISQTSHLRQIANDIYQQTDWETPKRRRIRLTGKMKVTAPSVDQHNSFPFRLISVEDPGAESNFPSPCIAQVQNHFKSANLTVLIGPMGSGKTTCSILVAQASALPGYHVSLSKLNCFFNAKDLLATLGRHTERSCLLVIDDAERAIELIPEVLRIWASASLKAKLLIASRGELAVPQTIPVVRTRLTNSEVIHFVDHCLYRLHVPRLDEIPRPIKLRWWYAMGKNIANLKLALQVNRDRIVLRDYFLDDRVVRTSIQNDTLKFSSIADRKNLLLIAAADLHGLTVPIDAFEAPERLEHWFRKSIITEEGHGKGHAHYVLNPPGSGRFYLNSDKEALRFLFEASHRSPFLATMIAWKFEKDGNRPAAAQMLSQIADHFERIICFGLQYLLPIVRRSIRLGVLDKPATERLLLTHFESLWPAFLDTPISILIPFLDWARNEYPMVTQRIRVMLSVDRNAERLISHLLNYPLPEVGSIIYTPELNTRAIQKDQFWNLPFINAAIETRVEKDSLPDVLGLLIPPTSGIPTPFQYSVVAALTKERMSRAIREKLVLMDVRWLTATFRNAALCKNPELNKGLKKALSHPTVTSSLEAKIQNADRKSLEKLKSAGTDILPLKAKRLIAKAATAAANEKLKSRTAPPTFPAETIFSLGHVRAFLFKHRQKLTKRRFQKLWRQVEQSFTPEFLTRVFQRSTLPDFQRLVKHLEGNGEDHIRSLIIAAESTDGSCWQSKVLEMNFYELGNFLSFIKPRTERMYKATCLLLNSPIPEVKERITSNALSCPLDQVQPIHKFAIKEDLQNLKETLFEAMTSPLHQWKRAEQMWRTPLGYLTGFVKFSRIHFPALLRELPDSWTTTATTKRIESIVEPSWIADVASFLRLVRSIAPDPEYQAIRRNLLTSQALQKLALKARALPTQHLSALDFFKNEDPYIYSLITGVDSSDVQVFGSKTSQPPT